MKEHPIIKKRKKLERMTEREKREEP